MDLPRHWRLKAQRYHLAGVVCQDCGAKLFPPRQICPDCESENLHPRNFRGTGQVYSYSIIRQAPLGFNEFEPYAVALVELDGGPIVTAQLTDLGSRKPTIGMPVEMVVRKLREYGAEGLIVYGYKFRPKLRKD